MATWDVASGPRKQGKQNVARKQTSFLKPLRDPFQITHTAESSRCKWYSIPEQTTKVMLLGRTLAAAEKQLLFTVSYGTSWSRALHGDKMMYHKKETNLSNAQWKEKSFLVWRLTATMPLLPKTYMNHHRITSHNNNKNENENQEQINETENGKASVCVTTWIDQWQTNLPHRNPLRSFRTWIIISQSSTTNHTWMTEVHTSNNHWP